MKKVILLAIVMSITFINLFISQNENKKRAKFALTELVALAEGEHFEGTEIGESDGENNHRGMCITSFSTKLTYQQCEIMGSKTEVLSRRDLTHICDGKGNGSCTKGHFYEFYNCMGLPIETNDFVYPITCE